MHKYNYDWRLKDTTFTKDKGKVFSCFSCGGGSSMGYKLAGFDVIGCNEIDPRMMDIYIKNHNPEYHFLAPIQEFKNYEDLPEELYNLDILDGSPPCSSFSMVGNREKDWGKQKKFKEGQSKQVLDTLFFDFIDLAKKLQPKVVIAENVKGILLGNAIEYVKRIYQEFDKAGYYVQHFLLDASTMGVPQRRERVFFIALRKDLAKPFLIAKDLFTVVPSMSLDFKEAPIEFWNIADYQGKEVTGRKIRQLWENKKYGDCDLSDASKRLYNKDSFFSRKIVYLDKVCGTLVANDTDLIHYEKPYYLSKNEACKMSSFPLDYDFDKRLPHYVMGMSVPPVMVAQVADQVYNQWLQHI